MSTGIGGTSESHESRAGVGALMSGFHVYDHADHEGGNNGRSGGNEPSRCAAAASCALPSSIAVRVQTRTDTCGVFAER
jgi:hypothetical protein